MRSTSTTSKSSKRNTIRQLPLTRTDHRPRRSPFNGCSRYSGVSKLRGDRATSRSVRIPTDTAHVRRVQPPGIVSFVESSQASVDDFRRGRSVARCATFHQLLGHSWAARPSSGRIHPVAFQPLTCQRNFLHFSQKNKTPRLIRGGASVRLRQ